MADQATAKVQRIKILKSGERVIIDPAVTVSSIMLLYYCEGFCRGILATLNSDLT